MSSRTAWVATVCLLLIFPSASFGQKISEGIQLARSISQLLVNGTLSKNLAQETFKRLSKEEQTLFIAVWPAQPGPQEKKRRVLEDLISVRKKIACADELAILRTEIAALQPKENADACGTKSIVACHTWAHRLMDEGKEQQAVEAFRSACERDPLQGCDCLGEYLLAKEQLQEAASVLERGCVAGDGSSCANYRILLTKQNRQDEWKAVHLRACEAGLIGCMHEPMKKNEGRLMIVVRGGGALVSIHIDGKHTGLWAPDFLDLAKGEHRVCVRFAEANEICQTIQIEEGKARRVVIRPEFLEPGSQK